MAERTYQQEVKEAAIHRLRAMQKELPPFLDDFFVYCLNIYSPRTPLAYSYDLKLFFTYLLENHPAFQEKTMQTIEACDLDQVEAEDIDRFVAWLSLYTRPDEKNPDKQITYTNNNNGKLRKLSSVRSLYKYLYKRKKVKANPAAIADAPKIHDKPVVRMEVNEMCDFLDAVETGAQLTKQQKAFHEKTKLRDLAITTLLLGTGMRVSECVGINIKDLDFTQNAVRVTRKGGDESMIYFGQEVASALQNYLAERKKHPDDTEPALFLSLQGKRIGVRSVQLLVKKYAQTSVKLKKITPHKLRSTFGTNLYQDTGDIYLVAASLGHEDVNTTTKHYAAIEEYQKQKAAQNVHLRQQEAEHESVKTSI